MDNPKSLWVAFGESTLGRTIRKFDSHGAFQDSTMYVRHDVICAENEKLATETEQLRKERDELAEFIRNALIDYPDNIFKICAKAKKVTENGNA